MLFSRPSRDQLIALGGVFQACHLVDSLGRLGNCDSRAFATCIHSLFQQNPTSVDAVFDGTSGLAVGFEAMADIFGNSRSRRQPESLRYVLGVLYLEKKVMANKAMLDRIGKGIEGARRQAEHFNETHTNVIANLADLYQQTISTLRFRIQVKGLAEHLQQPDIANRIRCLLFAGIRSAILWHQLGGRRRHLIFNRGDILDGVRDLRRSL
jgi:high frequency lysogenization protein